MPKSRYEKYAWFVLFYSVAVILWGAYVRATGSGAGCGSHWPLCNGQVIPRAERIQTAIEFSHRLSSGVSLLFVFILFVWTLLKFPKGFQRRAATFAFIAIILEALVGAMLVLLRLVEHDKSIDRVISISLHLGNTLLLLASLTITALAPRIKIPHLWPTGKTERRWLSALFLGFMLLGMLGAMTALGDTLFPSTSFQEGFRGDFDEKRHFLERLRIIHPLFAVVWYGALWLYVAKVWESLPELSLHGKWLLALASLNLILGLTNIALLAPIWMQAVHLLVADLIWITFVSFAFSAASRWHLAGISSISKA